VRIFVFRKSRLDLAPGQSLSTFLGGEKRAGHRPCILTILRFDTPYCAFKLTLILLTWRIWWAPNTYFLTYLLTPRSRVLLEKLTGSAAGQEIPRIFGTRRFITVLTSARHLSLFWANSFQSSNPLQLPEDGELLIMPANGRWDLTWRLKG